MTPYYHEKKLRLQNGKIIPLFHKDALFNPKQISIIERTKKAKYLGEFPYKSKAGSWVNQPVAFFYQEEAHPHGSNYFGLNQRPNGLVIFDVGHLLATHFTAILSKDGSFALHSTFRHDYQAKDNVMADGGMEYTRYSGGEPFEFTLEQILG